ncbi:hypothetical protein T265_12219 [Opisthorchis viverrini]|uniref:Uncharacterized protein n=1 Tax=Opisthorchis viverrini TaxID=6198 RepID=A0A074YV97_OPIVI|nr:hypothetical protein T265_12219 [Opisthorchis viverrini]KER18608.1 hypothetical protein T265_12219 [Opisthorchis viverrini]
MAHELTHQPPVCEILLLVFHGCPAKILICLCFCDSNFMHYVFVTLWGDDHFPLPTSLVFILLSLSVIFSRPPPRSPSSPHTCMLCMCTP